MRMLSLQSWFKIFTNPFKRKDKTQLYLGQGTVSTET